MTEQKIAAKASAASQQSVSTAKKKGSERLSPLTTKYIAREFMPELYIPICNWRDAALYPKFKPEHLLTQDDYLRLAWEVLRRVPRYRWHYKRISKSGLLATQTFKNNTYCIDSNDGPKRLFPGWKNLLLEHYYCGPEAQSGESLGAYAERNVDVSWRVFHPHGWAMKLWGISELLDPETLPSAKELRRFFAPSYPELISAAASDEVVQKEFALAKAQKRKPTYGDKLIGNEQPLHYATDVDARELLVRLRVDMSLKTQVEIVERLLSKSQRKAHLVEMGDAAKLRDVGLASIWLRAWDASEKATMDSAKLSPTALVGVLESDAAVVSKADRDYIIGEKDGVDIDFARQMATAMKPERVKKWLTRAEGYILGKDDFYRNSVMRACDL